ncbi:Hint domain-containing protein [Nioella sp.]|uniref:Hint domain-containing protein n=1 Tax=Nioella sp. TaxID=1912091 RepID=UPI003B529DA8
MPTSTFMNFSALFFQGSISGNTLTISSSVANLSGGNYLWDMDDSTTINSGDILALSGSVQAPYSGYGIIPLGTTTMYPIFGPDGGGRYWIPHDNTLNISQFGVTNTVQPLSVFCFHAGTQISTPTGEVEVENLTIGDPVLTAEGHVVPIKWIGRQTVSTRFGPAERLMPVRFAAGSLGDGLPQFDLTVTADHGMLVDGVICNAGALVNGTTITRVPLAEMGESYTVYHIETEAHEIILANGARAETFIDNVSRRVFDNYAEFEALYGDVPEMEELPYPRAMSARQVPNRIKAQLSMDCTA